MKPSLIPGLVAVLVIGLGAIGDVWANQCPDPHSTDKKVVFSTPLKESNIGQDVAVLMQELVFVFEIERERLWVERPDEPIAFVTCDREKLLDRSDLRTLAEDSYHRGVLLEVRSLLHAASAGDGKEALVQYASVPVAFLGRDGAPGYGLYGRRIAIAGSGDYLQAFVQPRDIDAYVATGLGLRYADERAHDLAWSNLCEARRHLDEMMAGPLENLASPQRAALESLRMFVANRLAEVVRDGRQQSGSRIAFLFEARGAAFVDNPCVTP